MVKGSYGTVALSAPMMIFVYDFIFQKKSLKVYYKIFFDYFFDGTQIV